jgi:hypothetical protein
LRVASVSSPHVHVRYVSHPGALDTASKLSDAVQAVARFPGGCWPPLMLEPGWVTANPHHRLERARSVQAHRASDEEALA